MTIPGAESYRQAAAILRASRHNVAFTGAGISVESGIPPFRGAKSRGAKIVEINVERSEYTHTVTEVFIRDKATVAMRTPCDLLCPHQ